MRVARYIGGGQVAIVEESTPICPPGGLLVKTLASGLCSGELMEWYMERKVPHVLGHEVAARIIESQDDRYEVGSIVFPHHHAPCLSCNYCFASQYVHCEQWRRTKLVPGGMAEIFGVPADNLNDTTIVDDLRPIDSALIEPLACVMKSLRLAKKVSRKEPKHAVVGLGVMGLMHLLMLPENTIGYDLKESRVEWAKGLERDARHPDQSEAADVVFVCPGTQTAFNFALSIVEPGGVIVMFAPLGPGEDLRISQEAYFKDITIRNSYSCGPNDTSDAETAIRDGRLQAEQVVSHFIELEALPEAYQAMKRGELLKPMVVFQ